MKFKFINDTPDNPTRSFEFDGDGWEIYFQKILPRLPQPMSEFFRRIHIHDASLKAIIVGPQQIYPVIFERI